MEIKLQRDQDFVDKSIELYHSFNENKLYYKNFSRYNKLITADPFYISEGEYEELVERGPHLWHWLEEQNQLFNQLPKSKSLNWLYEIFARNHSPKTLAYQYQIAEKSTRRTEIMRIDLSSFPFNCHEAQLRWGAVGHIHYIPYLFDQVIPHTNDLLNGNLSTNIQEVIDIHCAGDDEYAVYLAPSKYIAESQHFGESMHKLIIIPVGDLNDTNFMIKSGRLIHKATGRKICLIFRRELTLETLSSTQFGEEIIKTYMDENLSFEPDLSLINDYKLSMALAFDKRTRAFFSDNSRNLFLPTSLFDEQMESFNGVFNTNYESWKDFINTTTQTDREYVYKYGGFDLEMSFGSSAVYRLDRTKKKAQEIINTTSVHFPGEWIVQKMDSTRYESRYLVGDYDKPETCEIYKSDHCSTRFMLFYRKKQSGIEPILGIANYVNDYWKARFKDSDQTTGKGCIITPVRVLESTKQ